YELRRVEALRKKPSTSELIDWLQALVAGGVSAEQLATKLPFLGGLLKKESDVEVMLRKGVDSTYARALGLTTYVSRLFFHPPTSHTSHRTHPMAHIYSGQ